MSWSSPDQESEEPARTETPAAPEAEPAQESGGYEPGWYDYHGGLRFHDGSNWTAQVAPPTPDIPSLPAIALAVAGGMCIGWFLVWLAAQAAPNDIYWPVKFVVEEIPQGLR